MGSLTDFSRKIVILADRVPHSVRDLKRKVSTEVLRGVVTTTPIDTGQARFNWNVGLNAPNHNTDMTGFSTYGRRADWSSKMSTSVAAIMRAGPQDTIYISNALHYIGKLNNGGSKQAPKDYVRIAALLAARSVAGHKILR